MPNRDEVQEQGRICPPHFYENGEEALREILLQELEVRGITTKFLVEHLQLTSGCKMVDNIIEHTVDRMKPYLKGV